MPTEPLPLPSIATRLLLWAFAVSLRRSADQSTDYPAAVLQELDALLERVAQVPEFFAMTADQMKEAQKMADVVRGYVEGS